MLGQQFKMLAFDGMGDVTKTSQGGSSIAIPVAIVIGLIVLVGFGSMKVERTPAGRLRWGPPRDLHGCGCGKR